MALIAKIQQIFGVILILSGVLYLNHGFSGNTPEDIDPIEAVNAITISDLLINSGLIFIAFGVIATIWLLSKGKELSVLSKLIFTTSLVILLAYLGLLAL